MVNYQNGKIYKMVSNDFLDTEIYVGSTCCKLFQRLAEHRVDYKRHGDRPMYKYIKDNGGIDNWKLVLIESFPCANKEELTKREDYYRLMLGAKLNSQSCNGLDIERRKETHKKCSKRYYTENIEERKIYDKKRYNDKKEEILKKRKIYEEKNREIIIEKRKELMKCVCGKILTKSHISRHNKTKKHIESLKNIYI